MVCPASIDPIASIVADTAIGITSSDSSRSLPIPMSPALILRVSLQVSSKK